MGFRKADIFIVFALSLLIRLMIFYPSFVPTGDAAQFAIFVREISANGGIVPLTNVLYFPGSEYIYPPFLFLVVHFLDAFYSSFSTSGGLTIMRELLVVAALASSATATLVYSRVRGNSTGLLRIVPATVMILFTPDLYALSWGGYPFIVAEFFMIVLIFVLEKRDERKFSWVIYSGILYSLIALTHDLTFFFFSLSFLLIIIVDLIKRRYRLAGMELISFLSGAAAGAIWWLPRIHFVLDAIGLEQSSGSGILTSISTPSAYVSPFVLFAVIIVIILSAGILVSREIKSRIVLDPLTLSLMSSTVFVVFVFKDFTLAARIFYYAIVLFAILVLRDLPKQMKEAKGFGNFSSNRIKKAVIAVLVIFVLASVPFQAVNSASNVHFYSTGDFKYDQALIQWGASNFGNKTVVAPHIGNYIAAIDGVPVIVYGDFLVGSTQISQRNAATAIITDPGGLAAIQNLTSYNIGYVVIQNSLLNSTVKGGKVMFDKAYYREVYHDQYYTVEKFKGN